MTTLSSLNIDAFLAALAAKSPTPGGGAVASLTGALASALASMVVAYSLGRKSLDLHQPDLRDAAASLERARSIMLQLADEDAAAYAWLSDLMKRPESDPDRVAHFPAAVTAALQAPRATLAAAADLLRRLESLAPITNRHLRSDLAIAAILADATCRAAAWNVRINLPLLATDQQRAVFAAEVDALLVDAHARCARIEHACA